MKVVGILLQEGSGIVLALTGIQLQMTFTLVTMAGIGLATILPHVN